MTERRYFGTDGIRGHVGGSRINAELVLKLGWALGKVLGGTALSGKTHANKTMTPMTPQFRRPVLIGKDTRISGYMLESALEAGLSAAGADILLLGPMPTPAIAYLIRTFRADAGIVISASHNPFHDNGIKIFSSEGTKLPDDIELAIEQQLEEPFVTVDSRDLGRASRITDAAGRYIEFCKSTVPAGVDLNGLKVVVDCANGATYHIAPSVLRELGAHVIELSVKPDGFNINEDCGSTKPALLARAVLEHEADAGVALDGDGDRVIMVDHLGHQLDGDELLFMMASDLMRRGLLTGGVVGTVMSNLGFELAIEQLGLEFARAKVGDRHVMAMLEEKDWELGGEPSGHLIWRGATTTGDGIVAALQVLSAMQFQSRPLAELKQGMVKFPQVCLNVTRRQSGDPISHPSVQSKLAQINQQLGLRGRVLLRLSGTEPMIRVMVEGEDPSLVSALAGELADVVDGAQGC